MPSWITIDTSNKAAP
jgi:hypothetical protein